MNIFLGEKHRLVQSQGSDDKHPKHSLGVTASVRRSSGDDDGGKFSSMLSRRHPLSFAMPETVSTDPEKFLYGSVISRNWSWFPVVERLAFQGH
jgi:hypothetical protein